MRVYTHNPKSADGERSVVRCRIFTSRGEITHVRRVVFDGDVAEGIANVTAGNVERTEELQARILRIAAETAFVLQPEDLGENGRLIVELRRLFKEMDTLLLPRPTLSGSGN